MIRFIFELDSFTGVQYFGPNVMLGKVSAKAMPETKFIKTMTFALVHTLEFLYKTSNIHKMKKKKHNILILLNISPQLYLHDLIAGVSINCRKHKFYTVQTVVKRCVLQFYGSPQTRNPITEHKRDM